MFPEGTRSADGTVHEFKSGTGYLALRSGCDVLPMLIRGTHAVLGKGSLVPRRHPVEVRIGTVITAAELRTISENAEGMGAYRKVADYVRNAVLALAGDNRVRMKPAAKKSATLTGIEAGPSPSAASSRRSARVRARRGA